MTDKATPSLRQRCDTALQSLPDAAYKTMLAALFDDLLGLAAQAAPTDAYERTTQPSLATDYEAHQKNGLAWAVNSWMLEVKNRPLINVHRRTLDDTWRQVIRYFGGNPDSLIGPSHDALMDAEPKRNGRPISWGEEPAQSAQAPAQAVQAREYPPGARLWVKKPLTVQAAQWFKNGDHPQDYAADTQGFENGELRVFTGAERKANGWEGSVVRYYRHPDVPGEKPCEQCGKPHHVHGWIDTLEQGHRVCPGDWIITGVKGERYPCKPDIFDATYESADRASTVAALKAERDAALARATDWQRLYDRAINEANGLTNYVEDRPELRSAERRLDVIAADARALKGQP